jgi:hypothetical protein
MTDTATDVEAMMAVPETEDEPQTVDGNVPTLAPGETISTDGEFDAGAPPDPNAAPQPFDLNKRVGQYVKLRDFIADVKEKHKKELEPLNEMLEQLNSLMLDHLSSIGAERAGTEHGTVYRTAKKSASVADMSAFWAWVVTQNDWDLLDKKANVKAVEDFMKKNNMPVPGVNFTEKYVVGVRRR